MQTLNDRLNAYCREHDKEPPFGRSINAMGIVIAETLRRNGLFVVIEKRWCTVNAKVNVYSDSAVPIIDEIIEEYYTDLKTFWLRVNNLSNTKVRRFTYDVESRKAIAFEEALRKCDLPVLKNDRLGSKREIVQYILPITNHCILIKLGTEFQKAWHIEKRMNYMAEQHEDKKSFIKP